MKFSIKKSMETNAFKGSKTKKYRHKKNKSSSAHDVPEVSREDRMQQMIEHVKELDSSRLTEDGEILEKISAYTTSCAELLDISDSIDNDEVGQRAVVLRIHCMIKIAGLNYRLYVENNPSSASEIDSYVLARLRYAFQACLAIRADDHRTQYQSLIKEQIAWFKEKQAELREMAAEQEQSSHHGDKSWFSPTIDQLILGFERGPDADDEDSARSLASFRR